MRLYTLLKTMIRFMLPENGTFTPTIINRTGSNPIVGSAAGYTRSFYGWYVRVGCIVFFKISLHNFTINNPGSLGAIGGLPFVAVSSGVVNLDSTLNWNFATSGADTSFSLASGYNYISLRNRATTNSSNWQTCSRVFFEIVGVYITEL